MADFKRMGIPELYIGPSTDVKRTGVPIGSRSYETDTGLEFITRDGTNWVEYTPIHYVTAPEVIGVSDATISGGGAIAVTKPWHEVIPNGAENMTSAS